MNEINDFNKPSTPKDNGMDLGDVDFDPAYSDWLRREVNDNVMKAYFCMQLDLTSSCDTAVKRCTEHERFVRD